MVDGGSPFDAAPAEGDVGFVDGGLSTDGGATTEVVPHVPAGLDLNDVSVLFALPTDPDELLPLEGQAHTFLSSGQLTASP
jgi:hypothetical protein